MRGKSTPSLHLSVDSLLQVTYSLIIISVLFYKGSNHLVCKKETMQWIKAFCVPFSCLYFFCYIAYTNIDRDTWMRFIQWRVSYPSFSIYVGSYMCTALLLNHGVVGIDVRLREYKINLVTKAGVVFDIADLGYDVSTGISTAPNSGIYVFDRTILSWQGQYAYTSYAL